MATKSIKTIARDCLRVTGNISLKQSICGVFANDNQQTRSVKDRIRLVETMPFVRIAIITIQGATPSLQADLDNANQVYQNEANVWIYCVGHRIEDKPTLLSLDQDDCNGSGHSVSDEEDELFDLGRDFDASLVAYFINNATGNTWRGCAAHPSGRRGFWVGSTATDWTFVHEMTHVIGDNSHVADTDNLMVSNTGTITNPPPDLTNDQSTNINDDPATEQCF